MHLEDSPPSRGRGRALVAAAAVVLGGGLLVPAHAEAPAAPRPRAASRDARGPGSTLTDPQRIRRLAAQAYRWGLPAEFVYRFSRYNYLATAPRNQLGGGRAAAAWNNNATNAGDASVVYLNAMLDLSGDPGRGHAKQLVMTVPPSQDDYFVVNLLDSFVNTVGSIGTRTTPSAAAQTYLLAGPTSPYAHRRTVTIKGFTYRVMTMDTDLGWLLVRIRADTLVDPTSPASARSVIDRVVGGFALQSLRSFEWDHHEPRYFEPGYTPTAEQKAAAQKWHNTPAQATVFFEQMGRSLRISPLPTRHTGLNGSPLETLPPWVAAQPGARTVFRYPSYGQQQTLKRFAPLGLTERGFHVPRTWGQPQLDALQDGFVLGQQRVAQASTSVGVSSSTHYWSYLNDNIGSYPNSTAGYLFRAIVVLAGGSANLPADAVYAQLDEYVDADGHAEGLDGNDTYTLTFTPPVDGGPVPADGILPSMVTGSDGNPQGFWSLHVYATDPSQAAAPFITQASVLNTAYSDADLAVTAVDPVADTVTVTPSDWGPLVEGSPVLFGPTAGQYGLQPDTPYYVAGVPTATTLDGAVTSYTFQVSTRWLQDWDATETHPVPIQGPGGHPGDVAAIDDPGGAVHLTWGPVQPVSQLGSQQLTSGRLATNPDGSVTIWIGPTLPDGAPMTNWLPTPSTAYHESVYGAAGTSMATGIRPMMRMYYPSPGSDTQPSILPPPAGGSTATYVLPPLAKVG
ncbi:MULTISPECIES: DUF1254 domain-containing protein [unclassified Nocardioides]|uniref:DUF1254 domain-containing protein n=1 Tax=unclassified Nocardioides TaxID=2615069 RepID=UPI0009EFB6D7|nr:MULTISPECIES: DUF1254 domain-containing protein [unclassified Nocardioides]GAW50990.1 hypothetical protein PD653B2_3326 [Nocardioides sp. PD653-B2]GAW56283.1 hypothetical protein PD653_3719 [Nocardioides sp. PD653]